MLLLLMNLKCTCLNAWIIEPMLGCVPEEILLFCIIHEIGYIKDMEHEHSYTLYNEYLRLQKESKITVSYRQL